MKSLEGIKIVSLCINLPGPVAAHLLQELGAQITKVEPPGGDPLFHVLPEFYHYLNQNQEIIVLNLKESSDRASLDVLLSEADLLLTSSRSEALDRLGLDSKSLQKKFPRLCHVAIVGELSQGHPGHDLTYQAEAGLILPPSMPLTCIADMVGAKSAVSMSLSLILLRERKNLVTNATVALTDAARYCALPLQFGLTGNGKILGGANAAYNLYQTKNGWIALAALEPHFEEKLKSGLGIDLINYETLKKLFMNKTSSEWKKWAETNDIPLAEVRSMMHGT
ncbi:MAG: CoA transferase [Bacteriovorax sp.]|jgi:crotonobetainyl-CoA:carnitine CoA-transferase CaiB-like acyl-CoA transferase